MQWLLVFFYSAIICWAISRMKFFKQSGIKIQWWIAIFLFKVLVGILYGYIHSLSYGGGDTMYGFKQGIRIYNQLHNHGWIIYSKLVFLPCHFPPYAGIENFATNNSLPYGDESYYLIVRLHAITALLSGGFYNVHVVFYNILSFTGVVLLYSAFKNELKEKSFLIVVALILIPSVVFWTSGIHKDGLALLGIGMLFYSISNLNQFSFGKLIFGIISVILLYIVRSYILIILIPLVLVYLIFKNKEKRLALYYSIGFMAFVITILLLSSITAIAPFSKIAWWQHAFKALPETENTLPLPDLQPNLISFLKVIPHSINHSFFQPLPWMAINKYQFVVGIQDLFLIVLLFLFLGYSIFKKKVIPHLFYLSFGYAISLYVLLGIIVPNLGALSRYKSTGTFFLGLAIISLIPFEPIKKYFKY